jgi:hypothetical protein
MANTLDILRERLRSTGTVGIGDTLAYQVLSAVQEMVNARNMRVLTAKDITLDASTLLFDIRTKLTSPVGINIVSITVSDRTLIKLRDWRELFGYDQSWLTRTAARHEVWAQIGADSFVVYPAKTTNTTASVIYAGETTTLDESTDDFDLPTEDEDLVYDIAEAIFHIHMRNFTEATKKMEQITENIMIGFPGTEVK